MMNSIIEKPNALLYPYSYNTNNDVYVVRCVTSEEISFEPVKLYNVSKGLLEHMMMEYSTINGKNDNFDMKISFSDDRFYAIVDFNGRTFTDDEITLIVTGKDSKEENIKRKTLR